MSARRFFDRGDEFVHHAHLYSGQRADPLGRLKAEWSEFCQDTGLAIGNTEGNRWVPRLIDLRRDQHFEIYDVAMPGLLGKRIELLSEMLLTCRHAVSESTVELRPGVVRVVLNFLELPARLPFNRAHIPVSSDQVYFGSTALGSDLVWDFRDKYHGLIVGESGGGKTEAAALALMQLHLKGWELVILTPTTDDIAFQVFANLGHTVIAGAEPDHIAAARAAIEDQVAQVPERERTRAAEGHDWYEGQPSLLVIDESGDFLEDRKWESAEVRQDKQILRAGADQRARRGRKIRQHLLVLTQEPYVHNFGTPETLRQLSFRLAVTGLEQIFQPVVFQRSGDSTAANVRRVLSDPQSPKGRGIARGGYQTGNSDYSVVDEVPVQVAWCPAEQRARLLGLDHLQAVA
jgi:hypothetical protein